MAENITLTTGTGNLPFDGSEVWRGYLDLSLRDRGKLVAEAVAGTGSGELIFEYTRPDVEEWKQTGLSLRINADGSSDAWNDEWKDLKAGAEDGNYFRLVHSQEDGGGHASYGHIRLIVE